MVVGGEGAAYDVELIDLTRRGRTCRKPQDFPGARYGSVGVFFNGKAIVCGGETSTDPDNASRPTSKCFIYNPRSSGWSQTSSMTIDRSLAKATIMNNYWWVTGGESANDDLASTEVLNGIGSIFIANVDLPNEMLEHNIISLGNNQAILLDFGSSYLYNGRSWIRGPDFKQGLWNHAGLVTFPNGTKMVVAAGGIFEKTTGLLSLEKGAWQSAPDLPFFIRDGASVQLENSFLIVGGDNDDDYLNAIVKFDPVIGRWMVMEQKLSTARSQTTAFLVPDNFC